MFFINVKRLVLRSRVIVPFAIIYCLCFFSIEPNFLLVKVHRFTNLQNKYGKGISGSQTFILQESWMMYCILEKSKQLTILEFYFCT